MSTLLSGDPYAAVEFIRLSIDECFVYKLPPYRTASGHRAEDWGLEKPALTGCCSLVQQDNTLRLRVFSENKVEDGKVITTAKTLFAECLINFTPNYGNSKTSNTAAAAASEAPPHGKVKTGSEVADDHEGNGKSADDAPSSTSSSSSFSSSRAMELDHFVQPVADSSRYFVVRFSDSQSGKHAFLGLGFRERQIAFDFRATLQDFERSSKRELEAEARRLAAQKSSGSGNHNGSNGVGRGSNDGASHAAHLSAEEPIDHGSLGSQSGQKITLALKGKSRRPDSSLSSSANPTATNNHNDSNSNGTANPTPLLPPPLPPLPTPPQPILSPSQTPTATAAASASSSSAHDSTAPMPTAAEARRAPVDRRDESVLKLESNSALGVQGEAKPPSSSSSSSSTSVAIEEGRARLAAALAANDTFRAQQIMQELANAKISDSGVASSTAAAPAGVHSPPVPSVLQSAREDNSGTDDDGNGDWGDFHSA